MKSSHLPQPWALSILLLALGYGRSVLEFRTVDQQSLCPGAPPLSQRTQPLQLPPPLRPQPIRSSPKRATYGSAISPSLLSAPALYVRQDLPNRKRAHPRNRLSRQPRHDSLFPVVANKPSPRLRTALRRFAAASIPNHPSKHAIRQLRETASTPKPSVGAWRA